jgi:NitT/TauT family transport system substrate-binding protein
MHHKRWIFLTIALLAALVLAACQPVAQAPQAAPAASEGGTESGCTTPDKVTLQLKWVAQAQFAGYYAAKEAGYYDEECLDVTINPGGPDIVPEQVVAAGQADFGLDWLPSLLSAREQGTPLINVAQVFQRSAMREIAWADSGITSPADLKGKRVAVWFGGNEFALLATLNKYQIDKDTDVELVQQPFDMNLFLQRNVDAAAAMTYNELAQVLEVKNPDTGELYQLDQLSIIDFNKEGTAMLEDGIFVTEDWLSDAKNQDITERFLRASFKGWIHCRDNADECVDFVLKQGPALPRGHQTWQMNEINKLIWPSENGIGIMDPALFQQTADIALNFGVITKPADESAYTSEYAQKAVDALSEAGIDVKGLDWQPAVVELTEGGK